MATALRPLIVAGLVACAAGFSATLAYSEPASRQILDLIVSLDKVQPTDATKIEQIFGQSIGCPQNVEEDCERYGMTIGQTEIGQLQFRRRGFGTLLILEKLRGSCLSVASIERQFGPGNLGPACTDGFICTYLTMKRPWGRLSFRLPEDNPTCARSVVMDAVVR